MTYLQELAIREAVRNGDGRLMAETINELPGYVDFSDVQAAVEAAPGSWDAVRWDGLHVGNTVVQDRYGRPAIK